MLYPPAMVKFWLEHCICSVSWYVHTIVCLHIIRTHVHTYVHCVYGHNYTCTYMLCMHTKTKSPHRTIFIYTKEGKAPLRKQELAKDCIYVYMITLSLNCVGWGIHTCVHAHAPSWLCLCSQVVSSTASADG